MYRQRRGNVITTVMMLPVLMAVGSLSVDLGQALVARSQLQSISDLAARSAVGSLDQTPDGLVDAVDTAIRVAGLNSVPGRADRR